MIRRSALPAVLFFACAFAAAADAQPPDPALIAAAKKDGQVVWYTGLIINQLARPIAEAFEKTYGIKVSYVRQDSSDTILRISNEAQAGHLSADMFDATTGIAALKKAGILMQYRPASAANYAPETVDPEGYWTGLNVFAIIGAYNTDLVPKGGEPKSWEDLLDPKWRGGKIAWSTSLSSQGGPSFVGTVLAEYGEARGMDYLRKLAEQKIVNIDAASRSVLDQVIAGEYSIMLQVSDNQPVTSALAGAPVASLKFNPSTGTLNAMAVLKGAPHPNAGKLFVDYLASPEGQKVIAQNYYVPADPDTPAREPSLKPDGVKFRVIYFSPEKFEASIPDWAKIYNELFR
jgi:ABC-type Fe3+ transport system substrate-binding protein